MAIAERRTFLICTQCHRGSWAFDCNPGPLCHWLPSRGICRERVANWLIRTRNKLKQKRSRTKALSCSTAIDQIDSPSSTNPRHSWLMTIWSTLFQRCEGEWLAGWVDVAFLTDVCVHSDWYVIGAILEGAVAIADAILCVRFGAQHATILKVSTVLARTVCHSALLRKGE